MKLNLNGKPNVKVTIDLITFFHEYKKELDLKVAIEKSYCITDNSYNIDNTKIINILGYMIDWNEIIRITKLKNLKLMHVKMFAVSHYDRPLITPKVIGNEEIILNEDKLIEGMDVFVSHDIIDTPGHHIKCYLANTLFRYTDVPYEINLTKERLDEDG